MSYETKWFAIEFLNNDGHYEWHEFNAEDAHDAVYSAGVAFPKYKINQVFVKVNLRGIDYDDEEQDND